MKTFIRWQGNKSKHINKFKEYIPEFTGTYIEPFVGSGALFLHLQPKKWIINDLNKDLINIWLTVKDNCEDVIQEFKKFGEIFVPLSNNQKVKLCRKLTSEIETMSYNKKRAIMYLAMLHCSYTPSLIIKNKFYFQSLYSNISYKNNYAFLQGIHFNKLKNTQCMLNNKDGKIYNKSYESILELSVEGDFVFLDPPYIENHNYKFSYNREESLDDTFLNKLLQEVKKLDIKKVKWLMTQADSIEVRTTFKDYTIKTFKVYRVARKEYNDELVIMNY